MKAMEVAPQHRQTADRRVDMSVLEAGKDGLAADVDAYRVGPGDRAHVIVTAHRDDAPGRDRQGGSGPRRSDEHRAGENELGMGAPRLRSDASHG